MFEEKIAIPLLLTNWAKRVQKIKLQQKLLVAEELVFYSMVSPE